MHFSCLVQDVHGRKWTRLWPFLPRCTPHRETDPFLDPRGTRHNSFPPSFSLFRSNQSWARRMDLALPFVSPKFIILDKFSCSRGRPIRSGYVTPVFPTFFDFIETRALDDKLDRSRRGNFDERVWPLSDRFHVRLAEG